MNKGFTLIELIIVIAVIGIILMIAIPNFEAIKEREAENMSISCEHEYITTSKYVANGQYRVIGKCVKCGWEI